MLEIALKFFGPVLTVMVFFSILPLIQRKEKVAATGDIVLEYGWIFKGVSWLCLFFSIAAPVAMYAQERHGIQEYGLISYVFAIGLFFLLFLYIYFLNSTNKCNY